MSLWQRGATLLAVAPWACVAQQAKLPQPVQTWGCPPELALPSLPSPAGPVAPVVLSPAEDAAIEQLRVRGASITVFAASGEFLVHFPLGALERQWRKEGLPTAECGMSIAHSFTPDDTGPPMTDQDLVYLNALPRLTRVNLAGTRITGQATAAFRQAHANVTVEDSADE
jgi:hypothetical protein